MLEVIECKTRAEMRAFFRADAAAGYMKEEKKYLKRYAAAPLSLLSKNGPQAYLVAKRNGIPVFRALTGVDFRYIQVQGKKTGYFSLFDGGEDEEAAKAVMDAVMDKMRSWGMTDVIGPISPDGTGFFMGAGEGDFSGKRGMFTGANASFVCGFLRRSGFCEVQTENAFRIEIAQENPLSEVTRKAEERFSVQVEPLKPSLFSDRWMRQILSVSKDAPTDEMRLLLERVRPYIHAGHSYTASSGGECLGYLISLGKRNRILRATTLITDSDHFSAPAALSLINAFLSGARKSGVRTAEVSVINSRNIRSERLVLRFGGEKIRSYTLFTKNI